jgi:hypothetical protein
VSPVARPDREDLTPQRERLAAARKALAERLRDLSSEALVAQVPLRSAAKRPPEPDLGLVYAAMARVRDAENELDIAKADLATAAGADL